MHAKDAFYNNAKEVSKTWLISAPGEWMSQQLVFCSAEDVSFGWASFPSDSRICNYEWSLFSFKMI